MFFGTSQVESTNQGSKYIQEYWDKEYVIINSQGVTQNPDLTSKSPPTGLLISGKLFAATGEGKVVADAANAGDESGGGHYQVKPHLWARPEALSLVTPVCPKIPAQTCPLFFPPRSAGLRLDIGIGWV
jgi:hypothetical protein